MRRHLKTLVIVTGVLGAVAGGPGVARAERPAAARAVGVAGDAGFGALDGQAYATLQAGIDLREGKLELGVLGRVRLLVQEADDGQAVLRERDWDEASDFVHILRYLRYERRFGGVTVGAALGEETGLTLGHGSVVRGYTNLGDPDHLHTAAGVRVEHELFKVAAFVDNIIRPGLVALRGEAWPVPGVPELRFGVTGAMDPTAPLQVKRDGAGARMVDDAWNLQSETRVTGALGVDLGYRLGKPKTGQIEPYIDINTSFYGVGTHVGVIAVAPVGQTGLRIGIQGEYRAGTGGYAPTYFGIFHDVDRHQAGLTITDPGQADRLERGPKQAALMAEAFGGHSGMGQIALGFRDVARFKATYDYRPGPDAHTLTLKLSTRPIQALNVGAMVHLRGLGGPKDDANGAAATAEARYRITNHLYALAQYTRLWTLKEDTRHYAIDQAFNIGAGGTWDH